MQNRFVGDIGDFVKYGLLRQIRRTGLSLGVNWYLTDDGDDSAGKLIDYLLSGEEAYSRCDSELYRELHRIVHIDGDRSVARIEKSGLLPPDTVYYSHILHSSQDYRSKWFAQSLADLAGSDIIFLDPDNNILRNTRKSHTKIGKRYALPLEAEQYYRQGHSLIIYNHANREPDYLARFEFIRTGVVFHDARTILLKYNRQQVRYYLFILQPHHHAATNDVVNEMLQGPWGRRWRWDKPHFTREELN